MPSQSANKKMRQPAFRQITYSPSAKALVFPSLSVAILRFSLVFYRCLIYKFYDGMPVKALVMTMMLCCFLCCSFLHFAAVG